ncbi:MAG: XRE family transcriptional regulator [Bacteroidota bacterium]
MSENADQLRLILGLKLKTLRQEQGRPLRDVAEAAGVSISYLSEIEKGKKYPKPEKLIELASALGTTYDDLVSLRVEDELQDIKTAIASPFLREFPFELFGVEPEDVIRLVAGKPEEGSALVRTFLEVMRHYDLRNEHFLFAALRSYQQMHRNYFPDIEAQAEAFRAAAGFDVEARLTDEDLRGALAERFGITVDLDAIPGHPDLDRLRSIFRAPAGPRRKRNRAMGAVLHVNPKLMPSQRAFVYAREIGYHHLGLTDRPTTSTWIEPKSFDQVLNHFKASYFAGALLMPRERVRRDLTALFAGEQWDPKQILRGLDAYRVTPEMLYYRLTEVIPTDFGLDEIYFMRFNHRLGTDEYKLTKVFNMSRVPVPHGISALEHYCRRWVSMETLRALEDAQQTIGNPPPVVRAQRVRFVNDAAEFFAIAVARPLALKPGVNSVVSLGFRIDADFKRVVRWWDDPDVPVSKVNLTCERCPLNDCAVRAAPPTVLRHDARIERQREALAVLMNGAALS